MTAKSLLPNPMQICTKSTDRANEDFPLFSSKSFIALALNTRSLIHAGLIVICRVRELHSFALTFGHRTGYPVFPVPPVEKTVLSPRNVLDTLVKNQLSERVKVQTSFSILSHTLSILLPHQYRGCPQRLTTAQP